MPYAIQKPKIHHINTSRQLKPCFRLGLFRQAQLYNAHYLVPDSYRHPDKSPHTARRRFDSDNRVHKLTAIERVFRMRFENPSREPHPLNRPVSQI
jgi:hypothetical protein